LEVGQLCMLIWKPEIYCMYTLQSRIIKNLRSYLKIPECSVEKLFDK
jgi:hypothetical protein